MSDEENAKQCPDGQLGGESNNTVLRFYEEARPNDLRMHNFIPSQALTQEQVNAPTPVEESPSDFYTVEITHLSRGFNVKVGCQTVAIETVDRLVEVLTKYYTDPVKTKEEYYANTL